MGHRMKITKYLIPYNFFHFVLESKVASIFLLFYYNLREKVIRVRPVVCASVFSVFAYLDYWQIT